ncbi:MAG: hypothetical protein AAGU76_13735 [Sedimentibacter sp.]|uniref:hypothetical protein n=1 Tax=Sedimentibacter sp. TaxID=1960295 RepID=UPI0031590F37
MDEDVNVLLRWRVNVPIFKSSIIIKQLGIAVGIPFGLVLVFILFSSGMNKDTLYAVALIVALLVLTFCFVAVVYGGKYNVEYNIVDEGIKCFYGGKHAAKNKVVNNLTVLAGILSGKPAVTGAGLLAQSKGAIFMPWKGIKSIRYLENERAILIYGGFSKRISLFCTTENYEEVKKVIRGKTNA